MYNSCALTQSEYFREQENCALVNDDGSLNYENEYIKMEYGNSDNSLADEAEGENIFLNG